MTKNSKSMKFVSAIFSILALAALGFFIYFMVTLKGKYSDNLALIIGLGCGFLSFALISLTISPIKLFSSSRVGLIVGIILCIFAGVTLAFCIYNSIIAFDVKMLIICIAVIIASGYFGVTLIKLAKQDINIEAREKAEEKHEALEKKFERKAMTKCPYCGCRLKPSDEICPNCKSKLE